MDSNQSGAVGWTIWGPFQGSLALLGASGGLRYHFWGILTFRDPLANLVKILWLEMACLYRCPHIVLHISCSTRTFWGHFRPSKVRWKHIAIGGKLSLFGGKIITFWGRYPYWGQGFIGCKFITLWGDFQLGPRLLTFGGILLTFGGVIIINILRTWFDCESCSISPSLISAPQTFVSVFVLFCCWLSHLDQETP